jgi:uncharacterized OsmC-like protein
MASKMEFLVTARRQDESGSLATCKDATLTLDTALAGRRDAFNPAELLLAALSACMIKGIERVAPMLKFSFRGVEIRVHGVRQDVPPRMERFDYEILVDTDEPDRRLELLHEKVKKSGTVFNTVAPGTVLEGVLPPREMNPDSESFDGRKSPMAHAHHGNSDALTPIGRLFTIGIALNVGFVILEGLYGWHTGSLALLADAVHNLSDVGGLLLAWPGLAAGRLAPNERLSPAREHLAVGGVVVVRLSLL